MDHKVSKDMISSGMIPSGEKTQADLGRTQYGSAPSPSKLMDAYKSMYEHHQKDKDGNTIPHEGEELNEGKIPAGLQAYLDKKKGKKEDKKEMKEGLGAAVKMGLKAVTKIAKSDTAKNLVGDMARGAAQQFGARMASGGGGGQQKQNTAGKASAGSYQAASADLFDIVKGQLLDEGLSEEEIRDIMLTLTPDEIMKEIEESSMSGGEGDDRHMGTDDVARTKQQIGSMFNKNIPAKRNNKVDKVTRKAINTSARDLGIQGPTTLKQSVEPKGETI